MNTPTTITFPVGITVLPGPIVLGSGVQVRGSGALVEGAAVKAFNHDVAHGPFQDAASDDGGALPAHIGHDILR